MTIYDDEHSDIEEDRWISIGRTDQGIVCMVSHAYKSIEGAHTVRIISAIKADRDEEKQYYSL